MATLENILDLTTGSGNISRNRFFIPAYQRGYRWDEEQVLDLLNDLFEYSQGPNVSGAPPYCLQPVVVKHDSINNQWEVIDGQQRLTTLYLIVHFINTVYLRGSRSDNLSISYQTRPGSAVFLANITYQNPIKPSLNIDEYHMQNAYNTIYDWFYNKWASNPVDVKKLINIILMMGGFHKNIQIIWYQIPASQTAIHVFTRLNSGRIPLSNAELIKALFLREESPLSNAEKEKIASEWDEIEKALGDNEFWCFFHNHNYLEQYDSRIEYVFAIVANKLGVVGRRDTFNNFKDLILAARNQNEVLQIWENIKKYYEVLVSWYDDKKLCHLIGYLVHFGNEKTIIDLFDIYLRENKSVFRNYLKSKVEGIIKRGQGITVAHYLSSLNYNKSDHRPKILQVLLLFNIVSIITNQDSGIYFSFYEFRFKKKWDIEHISPQANGAIIPKNGIAHAVIIAQNHQIQIDQAIINGNPAAARAYMNNIFTQLCKNPPSNIDRLGNLTLLDSSTNRQIKNAYFAFKREYIIDKDNQSIFIPFATRNVFLKYYSSPFQCDCLCWNNNDATNYLDAIIEKLDGWI